MKKSSELETPPSPLLEKMQYYMEEFYKDAIWVLPDNFDSKENFIRAVKRLEKSSSPGYPYSTRAPTIGDYLGWNGFEYNTNDVESLWYDVLTLMRMPNQECVLRLFIKPEPYSQAKLNEGRLRIIMAAPLHFQVLWHMLFDYQNDLEIDRTYYIPSQQGLVLPGGGWKLFLNLWLSRGYDTGLDKTAWDWNVPIWLIEQELEFRRRQMRGNRTREWLALAKAMYDSTFRCPKILMSNGTIFKQVVPGVMKSGCVNTISSNSHMQVMIHILACWDQQVDIRPFPVAVGDDTLQKLSQAGDISSYAKYGAIVKSASDGLEFVGCEFTLDGPRPLYLSKHLCKLQTIADEHIPEYLDSMVRFYCKDPKVEFWYLMAEELGCLGHLKSIEYYNYWYDYETDETSVHHLINVP